MLQGRVSLELHTCTVICKHNHRAAWKHMEHVSRQGYVPAALGAELRVLSCG